VKRKQQHLLLPSGRAPSASLPSVALAWERHEAAPPGETAGRDGRQAQPAWLLYAAEAQAAPQVPQCEPLELRCGPPVWLPCAPLVRRCEPQVLQCEPPALECALQVLRYEPQVRQCELQVLLREPQAAYAQEPSMA
jgi:hypothetical protein